MAIGGRHVVLVALVTLLLTYAAFEGKSSSAHGASVSVVGRKGLTEPQEAAPAVLAEEGITTSQDTSEERTSEESSDQTSEETEVTSEELSDEPVVEDFEPSTEESTTEEEFATEEPTVVEESWNAEEAQAQENVEFSTDASEETSFERTQMREMEEVMAPQTAPPAGDAPAAAPSTVIENPDASNYPKPKDNPNVFLREIAFDDAYGRKNERSIQNCIQEDGCGTP